MPIFEVQTPDGKVFEVEAPSQDEAVNAVTGDSGVGAPKPSFALGATNALKQGATFGFSDEIEGVLGAAMAAPFVSDRTFRQLYREARDAGRSENKAFTAEHPKTALALTMAGGAVTGTPAMLAGAPVKAGALLGGVAGLGSSEEETVGGMAADTAIGTAAGAVLGYAAPKVLGAISRKIRQFSGKSALQFYDDAGRVSDDALAELRRMAQAGEIGPEESAAIQRDWQRAGIMTPEQVQRFNLFKSHGVEPNRFNVTQGVDDSANLQSALKRSGPVASHVAAQDAQMADDVAGVIDRVRPASTDLPTTNANVFRVVDDTVNRVDDLVHQAYREADKVAGKQFRVTPERFLKAIQDARGPELNNPVISHAIRLLENRGALKGGATIATEKGAPRLKSDSLKPITVREAEAIRQELNQIYDSVTPQGRRVLRALKDALDSDVEWYAADKEIFKAAREAKTAFHRMIERGARNKFDTTKGSFLEDVITNAIPEEKILPRLLTGRDDDLIKFKDFLLKDGGEAGAQAWSDIRAQVLRSALDKATSTQGKGAEGQAVFNARLFRDTLKPLMQSKKFEQLFTPAERKYIREIIDIGNLRVPVSMVQQGKGPTELAVKEARQAIISKLPFGERVSGLLDAVANYRSDRRLLDVTRETERALNR